MCPACLTTAALIAAGTTSAGGLAALVVQKLRGRIDLRLPLLHPGATERSDSLAHPPASRAE